MRDQGGGMLLSSSVERKKMSVRLSGREDGNEGVRKRTPYASEGSICGQGGATTKLTGNLIGKLKGENLISSSSNGGTRHHNEELLVERLFPTAAKLSDEGLNLPQWGRGKRSRCNRPEPSSKHTSSSPVQEPSKSASFPLKKPLPNATPSSKLRSHGSSKPPSSKLTTPALRNGVINKLVNGSVHVSALDSVRQVAEAKERASSQQRRSADCRHQQKSDGSDVVTTNHGYGFCTVNAATIEHFIATSSVSEANTSLDCNKGRFEWPRITIALTRKEKEEDFLVFKGAKLPQRPKKRLKVVEKALLFCTPGNWLGDLSRGRYDVREKKSTKKRPSGLKAMDSAESDSE